MGSRGCSCSTNAGCARLLWTGNRSPSPASLGPGGHLQQESWAMCRLPKASPGRPSSVTQGSRETHCCSLHLGHAGAIPALHVF